MNAIETVLLRKQYGWFFSREKVHALDGLTLNVPENTIFGFLGPNGAGKTTTIKILLGLVLPTSGETRIFGADSQSQNVRERVGYLPENPRFYPHLTARGFLVFCGKLIHLDPMERAKRADMLLERVDLKDAAEQKIKGFSRGMLQRVGIAQALIGDPDLVILDEPITGLDPMGRRSVKQILVSLRDEGKTIFFSSHVLSDVEKMCDVIGVLNRGRLIDSGYTKEILGEIGADIWAEKVSGDALQKAEAICKSVTLKDGKFCFSLDDMSKQEKLAELVQSGGGKILEVVKNREDLEEFFLRRVQEDEQKRNEGRME